MEAPLRLCQVAISSIDLQRSYQWYQGVFGFLPSGTVQHLQGPAFARVSGLPALSAEVRWLVDAQQFFQLEMFEFQQPKVRLMSADWTPRDFGYVMVSVHVADFDATLRRLLAMGGRLTANPIGNTGQRRACLRDPDGIFLELMEHDVLSGSGANSGSSTINVRSVTVSVPDLEEAHQFWVETLGLVVVDALPLHEERHQDLWGCAGAKRDVFVVAAGEVYLEVIQYTNPVGRPRPAGYLISDQGILNIALGTTDISGFEQACKRLAKAGHTFHSAPWEVEGLATVVYVTSQDGLSVELLYVHPNALSQMGFRPHEPQY